MNQTVDATYTRAIDFNTIVIKKSENNICFAFLCNYLAVRGQNQCQNNTVIVNDIGISACNTNISSKTANFRRSFDSLPIEFQLSVSLWKFVTESQSTELIIG